MTGGRRMGAPHGNDEAWHLLFERYQEMKAPKTTTLRLLSVQVERSDGGAPVEGIAVVDISDETDRAMFDVAVGSGGPVRMDGVDPNGPIVVRLAPTEDQAAGACRWTREPQAGPRSSHRRA